MIDARPTRLPVKIISDAPAADPIRFGFAAYADTLAGLIANKDNTTPMVVGVYGPWGSGKTSLMMEMKALLDDAGKTPAASYRRCHSVWIQAWKHAREEEILATLIEGIFKSMAANGFFTLAKTRVAAITRRIDQSKIFASISKLVNGMDVSEFFSELPRKEMLGRYDTFQKFLDDLLWTFLTWRFKLDGLEKPDDRKCAMVIFLDDLDRCPPGHIVKVLETIKLFMDRSGCVFVLGASYETLVDALAGQYGRRNAQRFLEKVVPTEFHLPAVPMESFDALINGMDTQLDALTEYLPLIVPATGHNPRRLKRFINRMSLLVGLVHGVDAKIDAGAVIAWGIIENVFKALAADIHDHPGNLFALQDHIARLDTQGQGEPLWRISDDQLNDQQVPNAFHELIRQPGLAEIVSRCDITPEQLLVLRTLSAALQADGGGADAMTHRQQ